MERWRGDLHYFSVPGGGIELGETPEQTVVRELAEETGCVVYPERELYLLTLADGSESHIFLCEYISGTPHLPADSPEAQEPPTNRFLPRWMPLAQLADAPFLVWAPIKQQLLHDLQHGLPKTLQTLASTA
jgi:8-oxo-dGTP pyrophosphatase MutT (NUDIX family)